MNAKMHPVARKCILWGVILIVVASIGSAIWGQIQIQDLGIVNQAVAYSVGIVGSAALIMLRGVCYGLGGALVAAAIVINVLAPANISAPASAERVDELPQTDLETGKRP